MSTDRKIKVLVVDDSAIVRKVLTDAIEAESDMEVVGTAPDPFIARDKILQLKPDVLTLDVEMPRMDGLTFLKKLMQYHPMPAIMISSLTQASAQITLDALKFGAVEVLAKPGGPYSVGELRKDMAAKIRAAASAKVKGPSADAAPTPVHAQASSTPSQPLARPRTVEPVAVAKAFRSDAVIAIGASTGGTEAVEAVLKHMPANCPGIVIAQHIPAVFSKAFADRLNKVCSINVKEACDGDPVVPGTALVAPGNFHMLLRRSSDGYHVEVKTGPRVCYQRPAVDVLFSSAAEAAGKRAVAAILTGMGSDGAQGMLRMKQAGARTMAQDEASCVVFGMPREAIRLGAADRVLPLSGIPFAIMSEVALVGR
jgi:two-component system chemotaxis response regulator CheB